MTCSIDGCGKSVKARGFCNAHWRRWRRHGDPLAGRVAHGSAQRFFEDVVVHCTSGDCLPWPFAVRPNGYGQHHDRSGNTTLVHRMACESRHGPPPTADHDAAHSCGNRVCCNPSHLRWATRTENHADKIRHGTTNRGERSGTSILSEDDVRAIRALRGVSQRIIAARFGVSQQTISDILVGRRWGWLKGELQEGPARKYLEGLL